MKNKTIRETRNKFYVKMAVPTLLHGSEICVLKQEYYSSPFAAQMAYLRYGKGCTTLDCFRNEDMKQNLNVISMTENIDSYRK